MQELSLARTLSEVTHIVRDTARHLTGADGASFVLRDRGECYYVDESAIRPLWKGRRFPMEICVSGQAMTNRESYAIEDVLHDSRVPNDLYEPTFVRSMLMVPIRTLDPIGAIGIYWAEPYQPAAADAKLLTALADATAVSLERISVYQDLEDLVRERTEALERTNARLVAEIAERRRAEFRDTDVLGRLGGDEFAVFALRADIDSMRQRLLERITVFNRRAQRPYTVSASLGAVRVPPGAAASATLEELLSGADGRMYETKQRHRGGRTAP